MHVPKRFLKVAKQYRGRASAEGWLEIDVKAMDMDGLSKVYVNLDEVASLRGKRDEAAELLDKWDAVFGKGDDSDD